MTGQITGLPKTYTPSFTPTYIKKDRSLNLTQFLADVKKAGESYLSHIRSCEDSSFSAGKFNETFTGTISPSTATSGMFAWSSDTLSDINNELGDLRDSFKDTCDKKIIYAENQSSLKNGVWNFLTEYFYTMCRIACQQFCYYSSSGSTSLTYQHFWGFVPQSKLESTLTLATYRSQANGAGWNLKYNVGKIDQGEIITGEWVRDCIKGLMKFNASKEKLFDHGQRNDINNYSQYVWGSTYYECDEGPFYKSFGGSGYNAVYKMYVYYKMRYAPSGIADKQDHASIWHYNYSDDHGHVYQTKTESKTEMKVGPCKETTDSIHTSTYS